MNIQTLDNSCKICGKQIVQSNICHNCQVNQQQMRQEIRKDKFARQAADQKTLVKYFLLVTAFILLVIIAVIFIFD